MFYFLLIVHCTLCVFLIGLVLIQQGKGADMGATFGGSNSSTVFGAGGAADLITKTTTSLAIAFMVTSILLVRQYSLGGPPTNVKTVDPLAGSVMESLETSSPDASGEESADQGSNAGSKGDDATAAAKTVEKTATSDSVEASGLDTSESGASSKNAEQTDSSEEGKAEAGAGLADSSSAEGAAANTN